MKTVYNLSEPITRGPVSKLLTRRVTRDHLARNHAHRGARVVTVAAVPVPGRAAAGDRDRVRRG